MNWERVGDYGMQCGEYRVAKMGGEDRTWFLLHFEHTLLKRCGSFAECRDVAARHRETSVQQAVAAADGAA